MMINGSVLILDDDELYRLELEMVLTQLQYEIWLSSGSIGVVVQKLRESKTRPDVFLIDVQLKEQQDGIELAEKLGDERIPIIFMTAFPQEDQFRQALRVTPAAYFIKPVSPVELHHAIQLAINAKQLDEKRLSPSSENTQEILMLRDKDNYLHEIEISKIYAVESYGNLLFFHTPSGRFLLRETLKNMAVVLKDRDFIRIHRRYLISLQHWERKLPLGKELVVAGHIFPVGRVYRAEILKHLEY